jgi:hypothetical protein
MSSVVAQPLAILGMFNARCMSDDLSCTQPPWPAIVADMLKSYQKFVETSSNDIQQ